MTAFPSETSVKISSPFSEQLGIGVLIGTFGLESREKRKLKNLYVKRAIMLKYDNITSAKAAILWQFYLDRHGAFESFNFFYSRSGTYVKEYIGVGSGTTTIFNLPGKGMTSYSLYKAGVLQSTGFTITMYGGEDGCDKLTFSVAPTLGDILTISFTGYLKIRARFAEQYQDFDTFYRILANIGISLQGLLNDE